MRYFSIEESGELHYLDQAEIDPPKKLQVPVRLRRMDGAAHLVVTRPKS
jgi:hypothetical protein